MEENNNNNNNKYPSIPPNYVTLVQLQKKWVKEQQRKQEEKEKQEEQPIRRNNNRKFRGNNRNTVEKAVVAANESAEKEVNREESSSTEKKKQGRKGNKKKNQSRAEEVKEGEAHAPPENENVAVRMVWEKKGMRSEVQSDNAVVVQSESVVEIEGKFGDLSTEKKKQRRKRYKEKNQSRAEEVKEGEAHAPPENENVAVRKVWEKKGMRSEVQSDNAVVVQSESVVEIEGKFGDLSMNTQSSGEVKNDRFVKPYGSFNRGERRGGWGSRGGGGYGEMRVWVKKGEGVDGNHSSGNSVKELE